MCYRRTMPSIKDVGRNLLQGLVGLHLRGLIIIFSTVIPVSCSIVVNVIFRLFDLGVWFKGRIREIWKPRCSNCRNRMEYMETMPCLHQFCRDCLTTFMRNQRSRKKFRCPKCKQKHKFPEKCADCKFKADFAAKGMQHFAQILEGYGKSKAHECINCSNNRKIVGYCFCCPGYLCEECYGYHLVDNTLTDHRGRMVAMEDATNMPLDRLASLLGIPMCSGHADKIAEFFCKRCNNLPICQVCVTRGQHKDHPLNDPCQLRMQNESNINKTLDECQRHEDNFKKIAENADKVKRQLTDNVRKALNDIEEQAQAEKYRTSSEIIRRRKRLEDRIAQISVLEREEIDEAKKRMERNIEKIRRNFAGEIETIQFNSAEDIRIAKDQLEKNENSLADKIKSAHQASTRKKVAIQQVKERKLGEIKDIASLAEERIKQLQDIKVYASKVLSSNNVWTIVQHSTKIQGTLQTLLDSKQDGSTTELTCLSELDIEIDANLVSADDTSVTSPVSSVNKTEELESMSLTKSRGECSLEEVHHKSESLFKADSAWNWQVNDEVLPGHVNEVLGSRSHPPSHDEWDLNDETQMEKKATCQSESLVSGIESTASNLKTSNIEARALHDSRESMYIVTDLCEVGKWEQRNITTAGNENKILENSQYPKSHEECNLNNRAHETNELPSNNNEAWLSDVKSVSSDVETSTLSKCEESLLKRDIKENAEDWEVKGITPAGIETDVLEISSHQTPNGECRLENKTEKTKQTPDNNCREASLSDVLSISSNVQIVTVIRECEESVLEDNVVDKDGNLKVNDTRNDDVETKVPQSTSYPKSQGKCSLEDERFEMTKLQDSYSQAMSDMESISSNVEIVALGECEEFIIKVNVPNNASDWEVNGIAPARKEKFVITGRESAGAPAVTVVNIATKLSCTYHIPQLVERQTRKLVLRCAQIEGSEIVTISSHDDIGIFNTDLGTWSVSQRSIRDLVETWPKERSAYCIATDEKTRRVIVGAELHKKLAVFDYQLNCVVTVTLPIPIKGSKGLATHGPNLLVCDHKGARAYAISIKGKNSELKYEFTKPGFGVVNWKPSGVTTDKNGFVYMLWDDNQSSDRYRCIVVQYSRDGRELLEIREVDGNSGCLTVVESMRKEKLLIATLKSQKVYFYDLVKRNGTKQA